MTCRHAFPNGEKRITSTFSGSGIRPGCERRGVDFGGKISWKNWVMASFRKVQRIEELKANLIVCLLHSMKVRSRCRWRRSATAA